MAAVIPYPKCKTRYAKSNVITFIVLIVNEKLRILPVAWLAVLNPIVVWSTRDVISKKRHISAVADGVLPNQKFSIEVISKDTGITISDKRRNEYLHNSSASDNICLCSFLPSALTIWGLMALRIDCDTNLMAMDSWESIRYAVLIIVPY